MRVLLIALAGALVAVPTAVGGAPDPARLVLRQGDVPSAYRLNAARSGVRTLAEDTREYPELRAKYAAWGHTAAYQVQFDHVNDTITSRVDLFRNRRGASRMLAWFVHEANRQSQLHVRPTRFRLGETGMLYSWSFQGGRFTIVLWRSGRIFSIVGGSDIPKESVIALARKQQRRIAAVG